MPVVRGTSGGRDGKEEKMERKAPGLIPMSGLRGRRGPPAPKAITTFSGAEQSRSDPKRNQ
jgi:hypothetical protein